MNTDQIDCFLTASRLLNFSKAAKAHYMTQQTFTNQIHSLEKELGVTLLVHDERGWSLTEAGRVLQRRAPSLKASFSDTIEAVRDAAHGYEGRLVIAAGHGVVPPPQVIGAMRSIGKASPNLYIKCYRSSSRGIYRDLLTDSCDVGMTIGYLNADVSGLDWRVIDELDMALVLPVDHPLAAKERIAIADLDGLHVFASGDHMENMESIAQQFLEQGAVPIIHEVKDITTAVTRAELGLGMLMHFTKTALAGNPNLAIRPIDGLRKWPVVMYAHAHSGHPAVEALMASISDVACGTDGPIS